ncbi:MAG: hypothetical protein QXN35_05095 [Ignisphaera sp.]
MIIEVMRFIGDVSGYVDLCVVSEAMVKRVICYSCKYAIVVYDDLTICSILGEVRAGGCKLYAGKDRRLYL